METPSWSTGNTEGSMMSLTSGLLLSSMHSFHHYRPSQMRKLSLQCKEQPLIRREALSGASSAGLEVTATPSYRGL